MDRLLTKNSTDAITPVVEVAVTRIVCGRFTPMLPAAGLTMVTVGAVPVPTVTVIGGDMPVFPRLSVAIAVSTNVPGVVGSQLAEKG